MSKGLDAINQNNGNIISISSEQSGIAFNVDLIKRIFAGTLSFIHGIFCFFAEMTSRSGVDDHANFCRSSFHVFQIDSVGKAPLCASRR